MCLVCCTVTSVYICIRCCCGGNERKRQQGKLNKYIRIEKYSFFHSGFHTVPQPIIIQTSPPNYQSQYPQQQAPVSPPVSVPAQTWRLENHPMLPQPSAPPRPVDDSYMDRPPPYEKLYAN